MFSSHHHASHLGRGGINPPTDPYAPVTIAEVETWADYFAAKYDVALFRNNPIVIRTMEENLTALAEYADELVSIGV